MAEKYKNIVPDNVKAVLKKLGNKEIRGGFFYPQKELKQIHDAGYTSFVEKVEEEKTKKSKTKDKDSENETD